LVRRVVEIVAPGPDLILLHVIDPRPPREIAHLASPLRRGPLGGSDRIGAIEAAEDAAAREVLAEALAAARRAGVNAVTRLERGRPEQVIVEVARLAAASVIALTARENPGEHPRRGPGSVGHTARFVVDHAQSSILLVRLEN
jgi:nucleotide-binding universal stress UspA family protein